MKLPWLWLLPELDGLPEGMAVAKCGCTLYRDYSGSGDPAFHMCPIHQAAPEMAKALRDVARCLPPVIEVPANGWCHVCIDMPAALVRSIIRRLIRLRA